MKRIIISGGGTGGHIFPAIAIANSLRAKAENIDILFIGAKGRMEMEKVPAAGYRIEGLTISGFQRRITYKNLTFPFKLFGSLIKARSIILKFKPDLVIGVGGYASGPTLRIAVSKRIPTLIQEQNSFPGITNRLLGGKVQKICVAYEGMNKYFPEEKIVFTGNPIRHDVIHTKGKEAEAFTYFGLIPGRKTLLVVGGSLGAGKINQAILRIIKELTEKENSRKKDDLPETIVSEIQILWQTGTHYFDKINTYFQERASVNKNQKSELQNPDSQIPHLVILPFIDRMDLAYAAADLIVSRAGALAISELCVVGKPVILVPSPNVAEDHQMKNACALVDKKSALIVNDNLAVEKLGQLIVDTFADEKLRSELRRNISKLGITDAAEKIADEALSLINPNSEIQHPKSEIRNPKSVYFLGIGGIGMSALARYFASLGASVSGYDKTPTSLTDRMIREGMQVHFREDINQIPDSPDLVIYTPAIPQHNLEFVYFKEHGIPMKKRAEVLGQVSSQFKTIAVAGTHGKTTTSSMIAHMLDSAGIKHLAFLGGISKNLGTNFINGIAGHSATILTPDLLNSIFCVVEADEYDRSFLHLSPFIAIITSADADHLDIYGNHDDLKNTFSEFTSRITASGSLIMKTGTSVAAKFDNNYTAFSYSVDKPASFYAQNVRVTDGQILFDFVNPGETIADLVVGVPGKFNLENAIAALAAGYLLGINQIHLRQAFVTYKGVQRRFDFRIQRPDLVYIDDYAHHPEELKACISAVREMYPGKRITGIFQPHLYTRTRDFADGFARSLELLDELLLLDIYPAREEPIEGITSQIILDRVNIQHKKLVQKNNLLLEIKDLKSDILLTLGAGDIDQFVQPIEEMLTEGKNK